MKKTSKPQKTNPLGCTGEPYIARKFAAIEFRCLVREVLERKGRGLRDIEDMLGSFAPSYVRGDFVPTIPDAYADAVRLANTYEPPKRFEPPLNVQATPIFTPDGAFRVEVRLVPVWTKGKQ
jgi:hypothetical protein